MKKLHKITTFVLALMAAIALTSCGSSLSDKIAIEGIENLSIKGFSGVSTDLVLRNESRHKIEIQSATITLRESDKVVASLELKEGFTLPKRTENIAIPTLWRLRNVDALAALSASQSLIKGQSAKNIFFDIVVNAKVGPYQRTFEQLNLSEEQLKRIMKMDKK